MKEKYYEILKKIEEAGFVGYIVGGYVRDLLLEKDSKDIDIITNATPKDLKSIFSNIKSEYMDYGSVKLFIDDEIIDITTFRKELKYCGGLPTSIIYTSSLEEDLKRRDFTINTLVMDKEGNIIDLLNARKDIDNKIIRCVRKIDEELKEDPSRILRALRLMCTHNLKLEDNLKKYIIKNKNLISKININKKKEELDKIFKSSNVNVFVNFVKTNKLETVFGFKINKFVPCSSTVGSYSQLELTEEFNFTKIEKEQIKIIKELINKKRIDKFDLYNKGLYLSLIAASILDINKKEINNLYNNLPIKSIKEIDITSKEICDILNINPGVILGKVIKDIEKNIINLNLKNEKEEIIAFLKEKNIYGEFKE